MNSCQLAIEANASAIGSDQQTYHEVLVSSFDAMHERLQTFFGASVRSDFWDFQEFWSQEFEKFAKNWPKTDFQTQFWARLLGKKTEKFLGQIWAVFQKKN